MPSTITKLAKNTVTLTKENKETPEILTWDEADWSWDEAEGTWDNIGQVVKKESKNSVAITKESKP